MSTNVLLGGNGYIGREVTRQWLARDPEAQFVVVSGSGKNELVSERVRNVAADATDYESVAAVLPQHVDAVVDLLGRPEKNDDALRRINLEPARVAARLAEERGAKVLGFVGGRLGPRAFTEIKKQAVAELRASSVPLALVEPTLVHGGDRHDALSRLVPVFRFLGRFRETFRPVLVQDVAGELVNQVLTVRD